MYRKLQKEEPVERQTSSYKRFFSTEKKKKGECDRIQIKIENTHLNIDRGSFEGSIGAAEEAIQSFADHHEISYKSLGHGNATLIVQGMEHGITPYGIDISMMLKFCNIDESQLTQKLDI
ncbi:hypothetical protein [Legionella sp. PC997]|uniref:hypothetical protein n=1 Tax=Legionella sp. PC997 TaxID=2755562 RepID=UPI0015F826A5|nr:hypothetical protein [Legionella sp. PC997]QMT59283.1 hypothetical protein HBNCFIEN_00645 [Legionella sp. PC997]